MNLSRRRSLVRLAAAASIPLTSAEARRQSLLRIRLVVLDIGGTIIQDRGNVPEVLSRSLSRHGVSAPPAEIDGWRGASKREIIRHFVDQQQLPASADRAKLTSVIHQEFTAEVITIYQSVPPIPGAEEAIREMRQLGYLVATTTGFDRAIAASIFDRLGWNQYFAATVCSDDVSQGRPSPFMLFHAMEQSRVNSVSEVVAVGDTVLDLQAGTNAGVRGVVGVLTGAAKEEQLRREAHTHILKSVASLPALLESKI